MGEEERSETGREERGEGRKGGGRGLGTKGGERGVVYERRTRRRGRGEGFRDLEGD